ncbi:molybdopterin cofactor-binding domain-containing protein, partial [Acinetobacter baumannii]
MAAERLRQRLAVIAASQLNVRAEAIEFADGKVRARGNPGNSIPFARLAATSHWAPGTLPSAEATAIRETAFWTAPELTA